ncbi:MAG: OmpH family outer membrane protein [Bdellovibrionales bacterium]|nr:OmpH family outer membrane protein [Bdellovibrionales bacterium]
MKAILMTILMAVALPASANFKAAYIDMQAAIQGTKAGKDAKKKLEGDFNKKKEELKKKEESLKKKAEEFEKKRMVLSEKVRGEKQAELQKEMMAFQQELQKSQMSIQQKERDLTKPILEKLQKVIGQVAKEKGYSIVFEKAEQSVMWANADLDITKAVVEKFEKTK